MAASRRDPVARGTPWLRLGRMLPARLRERVFDPAYFDLLSEFRRRGQGRRLGPQVLLLALETCRVGWPDLAWSVWRVRGVRVTVLLVACGLALSALAMMAYGYWHNV